MICNQHNSVTIIEALKTMNKNNTSTTNNYKTNINLL